MEDLLRRIEALEKQLAQRPKITVECMTEKEVAAEIGCSVAKVKAEVVSGRLVARFPNAARKFYPLDVERYLRGFMPTKIAPPKSGHL